MKVERQCVYCGRVVTDRTGTKCPNFTRHVAACKARKAKEQAATGSGGGSHVQIKLDGG